MLVMRLGAERGLVRWFHERVGTGKGTHPPHHDRLGAQADNRLVAISDLGPAAGGRPDERVRSEGGSSTWMVAHALTRLRFLPPMPSHDLEALPVESEASSAPFVISP